MITVDISEDFHSQIDSGLIEKAAFTALQHQSVQDGVEMSIVITSDEQLQALNRQYRDVDAPTDVLSFPADFIDPENEAPYLGDIVISFPRAAHQASIAEHAVMEEVQFLVIHGVLHLLGYDHAEPYEKATMWTAQKEILGHLGLGDLKISGDE